MKLNPFHGLPNARQVWAWGMYDLANQSFTLLVVTLFLPIYLTAVLFAGNKDDAARALGWSLSAANLLVVLTAPVLGAAADFAGRKKRMLTITGVACATLTVALGLLPQSGPALTLTLFALANIAFMLGENFLAAFLPEVSTRETVGRISAIGWTMGYIGALLCLPLALILPGVTSGAPSGFRAVFAFAGFWFLLNALPTFLILKEKKRPEPLPPGARLWNVGLLRFSSTFAHAARFRQLLVFLAVFCVYCCGMQVFINFSGLLASQYFKTRELILFVLALAFISAAGSAACGLLQDRIGQRLTVQISLLLWIATSALAALLPAQNAPMWHLMLVGAGIGLGLGVTGPASRAVVGILTPAHKTAEFFGLWGTGYKLAGVIGPPLYGEITRWQGQSAGLILVGCFFVVGLAGTFLVDIAAGRRAAEEAEQRHADEIDARDIAAAASISAAELRTVSTRVAPNDQPTPGPTPPGPTPPGPPPLSGGT
ncbi:MAG: MFS transporter [Planctomycetota bacterium]|nr:MFS transporter [Planctomycetota bacterium]